MGQTAAGQKVLNLQSASTGRMTAGAPLISFNDSSNGNYGSIYALWPAGQHAQAEFTGLLAGSVYLNSTSVTLPMTGGLYWVPSVLTVSAAPDCNIIRLVANVLAVQGATANTGWIQFTGGEAALAANFTDATGTLAVTNLTFPGLIAGRSYKITGCLQVSNSTSTDGSQFDFNGGTATATTFFMAFNNVGTVAAGTVTSTTLAGVLNYTSNTGTDYIFIEGYIKVNAGGSFTLRAATNTHIAGTMTLGAGSWLALTDIARV
jgi:hypothetical protein